MCLPYKYQCCNGEPVSLQNNGAPYKTLSTELIWTLISSFNPSLLSEEDCEEHKEKEMF